MMTKVIVTGASGFIGKPLLARFPAAYHVPHGKIDLWVTDTEGTFFLSTYGNMSHHSDDKMMVQANVQDLLTLLHMCNHEWFCYMSSSSVMLPYQTPYSRTKRAAEEILQALSELKSCIVRPYSVTGVGEQKEHLIPTLIRSCMEGTPMDFDASPVHDFVDVDDVVNGLIALADAKATGIHEFGSGDSYSNQVVMELVQYVCKKKANIQSHRRMRDYDNWDWCCKNPSSFFKHTKSLKQSIQEMVEAYKREHA